MADMKATLGMDDAEFRRGLRQVSSMAMSETSRMSGYFRKMGSDFSNALRVGVGLFALKRSVGMIADLMEDYAKKNDMAAQSLDRLKASATGVLLPVQRGLDLLGRSGSGNAADRAISWFSGRLAQDINNVSGAMSVVSGGKFDNARVADQNAAMEEAQTKDRIMRESWKRMSVELNAQMFQASGRAAEAELEREKERYRRQVNEITAFAKEFGVSTVDSSIMLDSAKATNRMREAEIRKRHGDEAESVYRQLDASEAQLRIDMRRMEGKDKEVAIERLRLEMAQRIYAIEQMGVLTQEERVQRIERVKALYGQLESATGAAFDREARGSMDVRREVRGFLAPGQANPALLQGVFGANIRSSGGGASSQDRVVKPLDEMRASTSKMLEHLVEIASAVSRGIPATAG
jgi:hypothetical protein